MEPAGRTRLCPQYLPPGQDLLHERAHAQLTGDGQRFDQQCDGLPAAACYAVLKPDVRTVASPPGLASLIRGGVPVSLPRGFNVLIVPEQVGRIVGVLDLAQTAVIGTEGGKGQVAVSIPPNVVDVNPAGRIRLKGVP